MKTATIHPEAVQWHRLKTARNSTLRKVVGVILVVLGILIHFIPFVPAGWIILVGLEFLGVRLLFWDKIKTFWRETKEWLAEIESR